MSKNKNEGVSWTYDTPSFSFLLFRIIVTIGETVNEASLIAIFNS